MKAGYLVREVFSQGNELHLSADFNDTTSVEIIGVPSEAQLLLINNEPVKYQVNSNGDWSTTFTYQEPNFSVPDLKALD